MKTMTTLDDDRPFYALKTTLLVWTSRAQKFGLQVKIDSKLVV